MTASIDLPAELLEQAQAMAARRQTTLNAVVEDALRREIASEPAVPDADAGYIIDEEGVPVLTKKNSVVTSEMVYKMMEDLGV